MSTRLDARVVVRILCDACAGLHAAHELVDERGRAVGLIHRDISPQNILVGEDGIARVTDFGVAKFARRDGSKSTTGAGTLKGKLAYMSPEYLRGEPIDRRADIFALGVVLWECLVGARLFRGAADVDTFERVLEHVPPPVSIAAEDSSLAPLDAVVACALEKSAAARLQDAAAMGAALERAAMTAGLLGTASDVAASLRELAGDAITRRRAEVRAMLAHEPSLASLGLAPLPSPVVDLADTIRSDRVLPSTTLPLAQPIPAQPPPRPDEPVPSLPTRSLLPIAIGGACALVALAAGVLVVSSSSPPAKLPAGIVAVASSPPSASPSISLPPPPPPPPSEEPPVPSAHPIPPPAKPKPAPSVKRPPSNPYE